MQLPIIPQYVTPCNNTNHKNHVTIMIDNEVIKSVIHTFKLIILESVILTMWCSWRYLFKYEIEAGITLNNCCILKIQKFFYKQIDLYLFWDQRD